MPAELEKNLEQTPVDTQTDSVKKLAEEFEKPQEPAPQPHPMQDTALKAYNSHVKESKEDKLILEFLPMVHRIVHQVVSYLNPPLTMDDLVSAGTIGLVKAARDFDPTRDAEFKTYAYIRIKGAVIDELRSWSFTPSSLKKQLEQAQETFQVMTEENGKEPTDKEIAQKMGISVDKLYKIYENARARHFLTIHGISEESPCLGQSLVSENTQMPGDNLEREELINQLTEAITELPEKLRRIIILYYHKELTMKEVAEVLSVTESRVSQLHASALFKLSNYMKQWNDSLA